MEDNNLKEHIIENIAMSEFGKEYIMKEKKCIFKLNFNYKKVAVLTFCICFIITGAIYSKTLIENFTHKEVIYPQSISNAINNGYIEDLNMEYIYSDEIGLKINSLLLSDDVLNFELDFKLTKNISLQSNKFAYGYIIYNENNEIYYFENFTGNNSINEFIKENNLIQNNYINYENITFKTFTDSNIVTNHLYCAQKPLPQSKKLYIKVIGIGFLSSEGKYNSLSNSNWTIELSIPDKFYSSEGIEYKLQDETKEISIEKFLVTDTGTLFTASVPTYLSPSDICLIDESGNNYNISFSISYNRNESNQIIITTNFPINKKMLTDKLYLKFNLNSEEKIYELKKK